MVWRIALHERRPASSTEIIYGMCMDDAIDAHRALDAFEAAVERARQERE